MIANFGIGTLRSLAASLRGRRRARPRRVVYTCLFGFSEHFNDFVYERDDIDFVCFTDDPELRSRFWTVKLLPRGPGQKDQGAAASFSA